MGCYYCNQWAGRALGPKAVCEDCYQVAKVVPDGSRTGVITDRLQKIHGLLIKQEQKGYVKQWTDEIANRLQFLGEVETGSLVTEAVQGADPVQEVVTPAVATKSKKLVVKKFR